MAQGIFGNNVLGTKPHGLLGLGASYECNPSDPTYDPEWCAQSGGSTGPIWTSQCAYSPWVYSPETVKTQQQMVNRGAVDLKVDGKWGPCTEQAYQTIYGEPLSQQSLRRQGIECTSFQQADKNGWGRKPNPAECATPVTIVPKDPPRVDVPPPVIPETPPIPTCASNEKLGPGNLCVPACAQGFHLSPDTLQCLIDQVVCPPGQAPDANNICIPTSIGQAMCPGHKVRSPNGTCVDNCAESETLVGNVCVPVQLPAPPTGPQAARLSTVRAPNLLDMLTGAPAQAAQPSARQGIVSVPIRGYKLPTAPVQTSATQAPSPGGLKIPSFRGLKLPGGQQSVRLDPVTGQVVVKSNWIDGIPNWLVVAAALAAAGGGYYYYQKKHKKPGTKAPGSK